jgi:hypothetical protein
MVKVLPWMALLMIAAAYQISGIGENWRLKQRTGHPAKVFVLNTLDPGTLLTHADAKEIMGEDAHLKDQTTEQKDGKTRHLISYMADSNASENDQPSALYFLYEQYEVLASARNRFTTTKESNEHLGIDVVEGLGDEAYYHTDGENFYFVMVRKGNVVFNMKVNKLTVSTSLEAFRQVTQRIAGEI